MCFSLLCNFCSCRNCSSLKEAALRGGVDGYPSAVVTCVFSLSSPSQALMKPVSHCLQQRRQSGKEEYVCLLLCTHRHCQMHLLRHTPHLSLQRNCVQSLRKILLRWKKVDSFTSVGWYSLSLSAQLVVLTAGDPLICSRSPQGPCQMLTGVGSHTAAHGELFMIWFTIHKSLRMFSWNRLHWTWLWIFFFQVFVFEY